MAKARKTKPQPSPPWLIANKATLTVTAEKDGKLRITYSNWPEHKVIYPHEVAELRWVDYHVHLIRKDKGT